MKHIIALLAFTMILFGVQAEGRAQSATPIPRIPKRPTAMATADRGTSDGIVHVVFETEKGDILLAVDTKHAPITSAGFLKYVDAGYYSGGTFFRTTKRAPGSTRGIVIIQADIEAQHHEHDLFPPFALETTAQTGITHTTGTLSMPRWDDPNSATSGISIMVGESHSLDNVPARGARGLGYGTFGHVEGGWDVIHAIHDSPARGSNPAGGRRGRRNGQTSNTLAASTPTPVPTPALVTDAKLTPPIKIIRAYRKQ